MPNSSFEQTKKLFFPIFVSQSELSLNSIDRSLSMQSEADFERSRKYLYAQIRSKFLTEYLENFDTLIDPAYRVKLDYHSSKRIFTLPEIALLLYDQAVPPYWVLSFVNFKLNAHDLRDFINITTSPMYGLLTFQRDEKQQPIPFCAEGSYTEYLTVLSGIVFNFPDFSTMKRCRQSFMGLSSLDRRCLALISAADSEQTKRSWVDYYFTALVKDHENDYLVFLTLKNHIKTRLLEVADFNKLSIPYFEETKYFLKNILRPDFLDFFIFTHTAICQHWNLRRQYGYTHKFLKKFEEFKMTKELIDDYSPIAKAMADKITADIDSQLATLGVV